MTRPKDIGTMTETAVVRYINANGFPSAERRALAGSFDKGDIVGTPGVCWEVKGGKVAEACAGGHLREWQDQTDCERVNTNSDVAVLVLKRKAVGLGKPDQMWAYLRVEHLCQLICPDGGNYAAEAPEAWVRMTLREAVRFLRWGGYGTPLEASDD
jgi:hypothetical protein